MPDDDAAQPFERIEGAHEYVALLCDGVAGTRDALAADFDEAAREGASRRLDALRLIAYKLDQLHHHTHASKRILNDLRSLRRLLLGEQPSVSGKAR
jgi:hypothetical protein